jgi:outer membrane protein OmpA-like peptidoglycan-associated protein
MGRGQQREGLLGTEKSRRIFLNSLCTVIGIVCEILAGRYIGTTLLLITLPVLVLLGVVVWWPPVKKSLKVFRSISFGLVSLLFLVVALLSGDILGPSCTARGKVLDSKGDPCKGADASVRVGDVGIGTVTDDAGQFHVEGLSSKHYPVLIFHVEGEEAETGEYDIPADSSNQVPTVCNLPPRKEKILSFEPIRFDEGASSLEGNEEGMAILRRIAEIMVKDPGVWLQDWGFCSKTGREEYNIGLGAKRAQSVEDYIIAQGISSCRIVKTTYGWSKPLDPRNNPHANYLNRRAECRLVLSGSRYDAFRKFSEPLASSFGQAPFRVSLGQDIFPFTLQPDNNLITAKTLLGK